ncbi:hypothetical protein [Aequorivita viscosa]|uniref:Uncharacterized protein n=1 Tax=Aequorivita viscosa TaxID=797419 RepID=A0A1M6AXA7_9FLAO|nr:hypothetical protein [Aequorivita viscosa]SDW31050.1 hypothetical protein SAMN05216556_10453 [Aequorivita viscosa]SHI41115.1 hypothetical protein SAMN04487908_10250 [Aequorivita viscosa]
MKYLQGLGDLAGSLGDLAGSLGDLAGSLGDLAGKSWRPCRKVFVTLQEITLHESTSILFMYLPAGRQVRGENSIITRRKLNCTDYYFIFVRIIQINYGH